MSMQMFGYPSPAVGKRILFAELRKLDATRMEAAYSDGGDEGGVDGIKLFNAEGEEIPTDEFSWQHPLHQAADGLLSTEFGSWAGDFSAYGTLYADLKENRAWRKGTYETPQGRDDTADF